MSNEQVADTTSDEIGLMPAASESSDDLLSAFVQGIRVEVDTYPIGLRTLVARSAASWRGTTSFVVIIATRVLPLGLGTFVCSSPRALFTLLAPPFEAHPWRQIGRRRGGRVFVGRHIRRRRGHR
jgi:hypothetical protein